MGTVNPINLSLKNGKIILIRCAVRGDAKQLLELMFKISKEKNYSLVEPDEFKETIKTYRLRIDKFNKAPGKLYIVAEYRKKIIGLVQFDNFDFKKSRHNGFLTIFISKPWRGKSLGVLLMKELLNWSIQNSIIEKVSLSVFSTNTHAISLYRKMGFRQEGLCKGDMKINGKYVDSVMMYKWVRM